MAYTDLHVLISIWFSEILGLRQIQPSITKKSNKEKRSNLSEIKYFALAGTHENTATALQKYIQQVIQDVSDICGQQMALLTSWDLKRIITDDKCLKKAIHLIKDVTDFALEYSEGKTFYASDNCCLS